MDTHGLTLDDLEEAGCFDFIHDDEEDEVSAPVVEKTVSRKRTASVVAGAGAAVAGEPAGPVATTATAAAAPATPPAAPRVLYRNAMGQSWDGTGETPDWLQRAMNAGQSKDFYRVD
jgi:DNA-binding protein H-NS